LVVGACALPSLVLPVTAGAATLSGGATQADVAVAVVPTGRLGDPQNRFFQTFTSTGDGWRLTTPKGTATNGGLVVAGPRSGAVAVLPFAASHVTALLAMDEGRPGRTGRVIPALVSGPTSLTVSPASGALAMVTTSGEIQVATNPTAGLRRVLAVRALVGSPAGRQCGLADVSAAGVLPGGLLVVGGRCSHSGRSGLMVQDAAGRWKSLAAPHGGTWSVVRIDPTMDGAVALVSAAAGRRPELRLVSLRAGSQQWSRPLSAAGSLRSTAFIDGRSPSYLLALADRHRVQAWRLELGGAVVRVGPSLAPGTQALVMGPGRRPTAFVVDGRAVEPLALDATAGRWVPGTRQVLPLAYGTSG
jgi:hypothetical protein